MHAFLIVGNNSNLLKVKAEELAKKLNAKLMEYSLIKIEDVRNLNNFVRLSVTEPTLIYSPQIHEAGTEALNAFLKNLEEPQDNLYFVLTSPSIRKVLPTIVSRCEIIKVKNVELETVNEEAERFMKMTLGERINQTDKIKDREVAVEFIGNLINTLHTFIHKDNVDYASTIKNLEIMTITLNNLKGNGNVNLQLTNMVISLV